MSIPNSTTRPKWRRILLAGVAIGALLIAPGKWAGRYVEMSNRRINARINDMRMLKGLEIGIKGYQTEYNRYPLATGSTSGDGAFCADGRLLLSLMAQDQKENPRAIKFLDPPLAKDGKNGLLIDAEGVPHLRDSHGGTFMVIIDYENSGAIPDPSTAHQKEPYTISSRVIVYSAGEDGDLATWQDNVSSWQ